MLGSSCIFRPSRSPASRSQPEKLLVPAKPRALRRVIPGPWRVISFVFLAGPLLLAGLVLPLRAAPPVITVQPQNRTVVVGDDYTLAVTATGTAPLTYQWYFEQAKVAGQTNAAWPLTNIQTSQAGAYYVTVTNVEGAVTSDVVRLSVRLPDDSKYAAPNGGWTYLLTGDGTANAGDAALDGTWNHDNGSDSWSGDGRGPGNGLAGGVSTLNGILTIEDAILSGSSSVDNRRIYLTRDLDQDLSGANPDTLLDDGVTLSFRARLTPPPPADPLTELTNAPKGYVNVSDGKGMFGLRQAGGGGMIISFTLNRASEERSSTSTFDFGQAGLHMNSLNGDTRWPNVDPGEGGTLNLLPLDPTVFHEFWITIQDNGSAPGTHRVTIYTDGSAAPSVFDVTGGTGSDTPFANYLALGLSSTFQRGAFDLDFFAYKPGVIPPVGFNVPVGIAVQPATQFVAAGEAATYEVGLTGTPPYRIQWYRDGQAVPDATNATYTTAPAALSDDGAAFVVVAGNDFNSVTSSPPALLEVVMPPVITVPLHDLAVTNGDSAVLNVTATGEPPLTYQWRFNGTDLSGATNDTLAMLNVSPANAGTYVVAVSNPGGTVLSDPANLSVATLDYGDAPDPGFPTLLVHGGASHLIVPGVRLGTSIDFETDGQPDAAADGDDLDGSDDEDGVRFLTGLQVGQMATVEVVASTNGFLDAWIDFNLDGTWNQPDEHLFASQALTAGTNTLNLAVPATAGGGSSFARFRFSQSGGLSAGGPAPDGEVEDYAVAIVPVANLGVTLADSPDPVAVGSNLTVTVTVLNQGPSPASGVHLTNTLPSNALFVSAQTSQGSCQESGGTVTCNLGNLANGQDAVVTLHLSPAAAGTGTTTARVRGSDADLVPANDEAVAVTTFRDPPVILTQPQSLAVTNGTSASFNVGAGGATPLAYQWRHQGISLANQTNSTLALAAVSPSDEGDYTVLVGNNVGSVESAPAVLTVLVPPFITAPPQSRTNLAGDDAVLTVSASGTAPLSYQWYFNTNNLVPDATNATLLLANVQSAQAGSYLAQVSNVAGTVSSASAQLTVVEVDFGDAPAPYPTRLTDDGARHLIVPGVRLGAGIDFEPDGQPDATATGDDLNNLDDEDGVRFLDPVLVGQPFRLEVVASTSGFLDAWIDWDGNGDWTGAGEQIFASRALAAGTNVLTVTAPSGSASGQTAGRFRFSTAGGLGFTGLAMDGEVEDTAVTVEPAVDLVAGQSAAPAPVAVGSNLVYQLSLTNRGPSPAASVSLTNTLPAGVIFSTVTSSQGACLSEGGAVTCDLGALESNAVATVQITVVPTVPGLLTNKVTVTSPAAELVPGDNVSQSAVEALLFPHITAQPESLVVTNGGAALFTVAASGTRLRYQWRLGGVNVSGGTNAILTLATVQSAQEGTYTVLVSNDVGSELSAPATLSVLVPVSIATPPQSQSVIQGQTATLSVSAGGTAPLAYQWQLDGADLSGKTNATLVLANVQSNQAGTYTVRVSNAAGSVVSAPATLTVLVPPSFTVQPQSQTNLAGSTAVLSVTATGSAPMHYQWFFEGSQALPNATGASLSLPGIQAIQSGTYTARVWNTAGTNLSAAALLTVLEVDFGDAPDATYPTTLLFDGARHRIVPGFHLGADADFEPDARSNATASGDDLDGRADEDGVTFASPLRSGQTVLATVNASASGFLDAWIDFDANGQWIEPGEQIFHSQPLVAGDNVLPVPVPTDAKLTNTFARFRFSSTGGLGFTGYAPDGEVEDYMVTIQPDVDLIAQQSITPLPVEVTSNFTIQIMVSNTGPSLATGLTLTNDLGSGLSLTSFVVSQGSCMNDGGSLHCALGNLAPNARALLTLTARANFPGIASNRVRVRSNEFDVNMANNDTEEAVPVILPVAHFENPTPLKMPDNAPAIPYPSTLTVSGLTATVYKVTATVSNLSHTFPDDFDILLVGPGGQSVLLMSDAGGNSALSDVTVIFDDEAELILPNSGVILDGTRYQPTDYGPAPDPFPAPAPASPFGGALSVFNGTDPNGVWSLYVVDDFQDDTGSVGNGWSLDITTVDPFADLAVGLAQSANPVALSSNLIYTVSVTNFGPSAASGVVVTDTFSPGLGFVSANSSQGGCSLADHTLTCALGNLDPGGQAVITLQVRANDLGTVTNEVVVGADQVDLLPANNSTAATTEVTPIIDLAISQRAAPDPAVAGSNLVFTITVTNQGPTEATGILLSNPLPPSSLLVSVLPTQGACSNLAGTVLCDLGSLSPGLSASVNLVLAPAAGFLTNTVQVSAYEFDALPGNNLDQHVILVLGPPFLSDIPNQVTSEDTASAPINFSIGDVDSPVDSLVVSGLSSNPTLVPNGNLVFGGAGANRTLRITPAPNLFGTATITVTIRDPDGLTGSDGFVLTVESVNDAPTLDPIADVAFDEDASVQLIPLTGISSGAPNESQFLSVSASSSNPGLISNPAVIYNSPDPTGTLFFRPTANSNGVAVITVSVNDGGALNSPFTRQFTVTVNPVNDGPTISALADQTVDEDTPTAPLSLTVTDLETAPADLVVTGSAANPSLVPSQNIRVEGSGPTKTVTVLPATNQFGSTMITLTVRDGDGATNATTFGLTVNAVNDPPTLDPIETVVMDEDTAATVDLTGITAGAPDESQPLAVTALSDNPGLLPNPTVNYTSPNAGGTLQLAPATNANGTVTVTVTVEDSGPTNSLFSRTFQVVVNPVNDLPALSDLSAQNTLEDTLTPPQSLTVGDLETAAADLTLTGSSSDPVLVPAQNIFFGGSGSNRTVQVLPATNQFGSATVTVTVHDADNGSASRSFPVTVAPVNDPPVISGVTDRIMDEDGTLLVAFLLDDPETGLSGLSFSVTSSVPELVLDGNLVLGGTGTNRSLTITPEPDAFGQAVITMTATDPEGATRQVSFALTVNPVNDPPTLDVLPDLTLPENPGLQSVPLTGIGTGASNETQTLTVTVASNDPFLIPNPVVLYSSPDSTGTLQFTPASGLGGIATLSVTVDDGGTTNRQITRAFTVRVSSGNARPIIVPVSDQVLPEDTTLGPLFFTIYDADTPLELLQVEAASSNPNLVPNGNLTLGGSGMDRTLMLVPLANQFGTAAITLSVADTNGATAMSSFQVTVQSINDPPTLDAVADLMIDEDSGPHIVPLSGLGSGAANESQTLIVTAASDRPDLIPQPSVIYTSPDPTGTLMVNPATNATGTATITVSVDDGGPTQNRLIRTLVVTVLPVNDPPTLSDLSDWSMNKNGTAGPVSFLVGDPDTPLTDLALSVSSSDPALFPASNLVLGGSGAHRTITVRPATNLVGSATLTLTADDGAGGTASNRFIVTVNSVDELPVLSAIPDQMVNEDTATAAIPFTVGDAETALGNLQVAVSSSHPTLIPSGNIAMGGSGANRTVTLRPATNQFGAATMTVTVTDEAGGRAIQSFLLTVNPVNDAPALSDIPGQSMTADSVLDLAFSVTDVDSPLSTMVLTAASSNPTLVPAGNVVFSGSGSARRVRVTPAANQTGTVTITLTATDAGGAAASRPFGLTVNPKPPSAPAITSQPQSQTVSNGNSVTFSVAATGTPPLTYQWEFNGATLPGQTGSSLVLSSVTSGDAGDYRVVVSNATGAAPSQLAHLTVVGTDDANTSPTLSSISNRTTPEDTPVTVPFTVGLSDTHAFGISVTSASSNSGLVAPGNILINGAGTNRTVTVVPTQDQFGSATITLTASNAVGTATSAFVLTVSSVNDPPTLDPIPNLARDEGPVSFTVPLSGVTSGAANENQTLGVTAVSSDTSILSVQSISYSSPSATGTLNLKPSNNKTGVTTVTVTVSDGQSVNGTFSRSFAIYSKLANNTPPTVSAIGNRNINEDTTTGPVAFTVSDAQTTAGSLTVTGASSNPSLVPDGNIVFGGSGGSRTVTVTPLPNQSGSAVITVQVVDADFGMASTSFTLNVTSVNDLPTVTVIPNQSFDANTSSGPVPFTVGDAETPAANLSVTAMSSNPALIPTGNIRFSGSGPDRALMLTPAINQSGNANITLTVTDQNGGATNRAFSATVNAVNSPPTLSPIPDQNTTPGQPVGPIAFTVNDAETAPGNLTLSGVSSNPALVPNANIVFGGSGSNRTVTITPTAGQSGTSLISLVVRDASLAEAGEFFQLTVTALLNQAPTLNAIQDVVLDEDAGPQAVVLTGISAGSGNEIQVLALTAVSSNPNLIPDPIVRFTNFQSTAVLAFQSLPDAFGSALVTVTVDDGQSQNGTFNRAFTVTVNPVNDAPVVSALADLAIPQNTSAGPIAVRIEDAETPAANLQVSAASSDPVLVPSNGLVLGGAVTNRTLQITPALNRSGSATISLRVQDGTNTTVAAFGLAVLSHNEPPVLSTFSDRTITEDGTTGPISFTVSDSVTPPANLILEAISSNPALVPPSGLVLSGTGTDRTLAVTPATNQTGQALITLLASDGAGASAARDFLLTVTPLNDLPSLSPLSDPTLDEDQSSGVLAFQINDVETPAEALSVKGTSSNPGLIPDANLILGGAGTLRTLIVTPQPNQFGSAVVTLTVTDADLGSVSNAFHVTVNPVNDPPSISVIPPQTAVPGVPTPPIAFAIGDAETPAASLTLTGLSSSPTLVPSPNIVFGGSDSNRTVTITSAAGHTGAVAVQIVVTDPEGASAQSSFLLLLNGTLDPPVILTLTLSAGRAEVTFSTAPGPSYTVEYKDSLDGLDWSALPSVTGTGGPMTVIDPNATARLRLYRVRAE
jgi:uncharacterized repeat protein (TIGR01451 family)